MAMSVGYKVSKVHRVAEFKAGFVLRDFITKLYEEKKTLSIEKNELNKALKLDPENEAIKARIAEVECRIVSAKLKLNGFMAAPSSTKIATVKLRLSTLPRPSC
jgi:hypothetical protein